MGNLWSPVWYNPIWCFKEPILSCLLCELILLIPKMVLKRAGHTVASEANVVCLIATSNDLSSTWHSFSRMCVCKHVSIYIILPVKMLLFTHQILQPRKNGQKKYRNFFHSGNSPQNKTMNRHVNFCPCRWFHPRPFVRYFPLLHCWSIHAPKWLFLGALMVGQQIPFKGAYDRRKFK